MNKERENELKRAHELGRKVYRYGQDVLWDRWHREPTDNDLFVAWADGEIKDIINFADVPMDDTAWRAFLHAGLNNCPQPQYVTGWRYGAIPVSGQSYNYRDQRPEQGVSLMAIDRPGYQMTDAVRLFEAFNSGRKKIKVGGWLIGYGSDGEPLIVDAEEIQ